MVDTILEPGALIVATFVWSFFYIYILSVPVSSSHLSSVIPFMFRLGVLDVMFTYILDIHW